MIRPGLLALMALTFPAHADQWDCALITWCDTRDETCEVDADGLPVTLTLAPDDRSGRALFNPGSAHELTLALQPVGTSGTMHSYAAEKSPTETYFLSLHPDGTLFLSVHLAGTLDVSAVGAEGTCTRVNS